MATAAARKKAAAAAQNKTQADPMAGLVLKKTDMPEEVLKATLEATRESIAEGKGVDKV